MFSIREICAFFRIFTFFSRFLLLIFIVLWFHVSINFILFDMFFCSSVLIFALSYFNSHVLAAFSCLLCFFLQIMIRVLILFCQDGLLIVINTVLSGSIFLCIGMIFDFIFIFMHFEALSTIFITMFMVSDRSSILAVQILISLFAVTWIFGYFNTVLFCGSDFCYFWHFFGLRDTHFLLWSLFKASFFPWFFFCKICIFSAVVMEFSGLLY